jgi:hypothetical protein
MFARYPRRTVTGPSDLPEPPELDAEPELDDEQPAMRSALPTAAAAVTKVFRIKVPISID